MIRIREKSFKTVNSALIFLLFLLSCKEKIPSDLSRESIIPKPVAITATGDYFTLKPGTVIYIQDGSDELKQTGQYLAERLKPATGFKFDVKPVIKAPARGIYLTLKKDQTVSGDESYKLDITSKLLKLSANSPEGIIRGIQTIRQILPAKIELSTIQEGPWKIATGNITDKPEYIYRGAMLDVARHFFGINDIKRYINLVSYYKMNVLHLHLSDDQGWRIEIKSWPNLALHGGSTQVDGGPGGYYTQEQYSDIVKYAQDNYITIVPEIDMPGHTNAALASYAELNCDGKEKELYTGTEVGFSTLCAKKEVTYKFIDDVVKELASITPGPYIHIGGDESHSTKKEDYIPFINRVQEIVATHGKQVIGWDDISIATIKSGTVAQHWDKVENALAAVAQGAKILMSPSTKAYLDMKYDSTTTLGQNWAAYIEVDSAYIWDPTTLVPDIKKENIIGIEAPLWSETVTNMDEIEYLAFPRLCGIAEIGWTALPERNWNEYKERLGKHAIRLKNLGIDYFPSKLVPWSDVK
jgi:hexosaminidase